MTQPAVDDPPHSTPARRPDGGIPSDATDTAPATGTVLIVEDDDDFARAAEMWLTDALGVEVLLATDGGEGIEMYGPAVDVVLLDRRMPVKSGDEVLASIRRQDGDACVAMMTAVEPAWDTVGMRFDAYLRKPVTPDEILDAVERLFERKSYPQEVRELLQLRTELDLLRDRYASEELDEDERYARLDEEFERACEDAMASVDGFDADDIERLVAGADAE